MEQNQFTFDLKAALRAAVPLVAIQTPDAKSVFKQALLITEEKIDGKQTKNFNAPLISWNIASGLNGINDAGENVIAKILASINKKKTEIIDPFASLKLFAEFPERSIIFMMNAHRLIGTTSVQEAMIGQAIWNLRDQFKRDNRMLALVGPMFKLPPELAQDVLVIDEPFPDKKELEALIAKLHEEAGIKNVTNDVLDKGGEATKGLSFFAAETAVAMSFNREGFSLERLWQRKKKLIENTVGLSVYKGTETFKDVKGVSNIKNYLGQLMTGKEPPTVIVFLDELEKMFGGISGDLSGASQEQLGEFLRWTQDQHVLALMEIGHPGCTKSFLAKATAGEYKLPMVELNISALKGSLQGQTGANTRAAFKTISAIGRPLLMATSNSMTIFPPELKRRFKQGIWVFDLPGADVRDAAWQLYIKKFGISGTKNLVRPDDENWTLSEIETCCENAWRLSNDVNKGLPLFDAAKFVVPIYRADPEKIEKLRRDTAGKYLSADYPGVYIGAAKLQQEDKRKLTPVGEA